MRVVRVALVLALLAGAGVAWLALEINRLWHEPLNIPAAGYRLQVAPGASLRTVTRTLGQDGVIAHPELLVLFGLIEGADARIKLGEYALT
ncbi:MAG: hypothetical protein HKN19_20085, partial [Halioglobus sp.]|nr:hypothetical protein [Halioglobus sp.]